MSNLRDQSVVLSSLLGEFAWLEHGFGTRRFDAPASFLVLKQVHSNRVIRAEEHVPGTHADALISNLPGVVVSVRTADCVPILLADPAHQAVAAIHAGWRGTIAGIVGQTIERMKQEYGSAAGDLRMAVGPCVGVCCYEVGEEVAAPFREILPVETGAGGKPMLNLAEANRRLAVRAGIPESQIEVLDICTRCHPEDYHSYRRDKEACGRLVSFAGVRTSA